MKKKKIIIKIQNNYIINSISNNTYIKEINNNQKSTEEFESKLKVYQIKHLK